MKLSVIIPVYNQQDLIVRAIESVPDGCEIIVVDDGSTDDTVIMALKTRRQFILCGFDENKGVGCAVNKGLDIATGDYIVLLGSDDYFLPDFQKVIDQLDGTDLIYFNLQVNNGTIWHLSGKNKNLLCGSVKCMRRDFIGDVRCPEIRKTEDWFFYQKLLKKNPTEKFTDITAKHYNFPREGSLTATKL
jgi:glycosyltransferase involved in cell wall biosynthesis